MTITVLCIDDESDLEVLVQQKFRRSIRKGEYTFHFASNGLNALKLLQDGLDVDVIMTDINMPQMDGLTFLAELNKLNLECKVVVVSAYGDMDKIRTAMNRGAFDFLNKPINFEDLEITINKTYENVTKLKQVRSLKQEKLTAEASSKAKSVFMTKVSHELRTPLNAIIGISDCLTLLNADSLDPTTLEDIKKINIAGKQLLEMVKNILELSKMELDEADTLLESVPLSEILTDIESVILPLTERAENKYNKTVDPTISTVRTDKLKLRQILFNLLGNANKFTEKGTIALKVSPYSDETGEWIRYDIEDTGVGFEKDKLADFSKAFRQGDDSNTRKFGGAGLGLYITQRFITLLQGKFQVESTPGQGSTFSVLLPKNTES